MGVDEDNLSDRLVSPEAIDDPNRPFTKGEQQPVTCRDAWAAILFYAQMIAVVSVSVIFGIPVLQNGVSDASQSDQQVESEDAPADYTGIAYIVSSTAGVAFLLSGVSLFVMTLCPKFLIQFSLLFSLAMSLVMCVTAFMYGGVLGGVFGFIIFALSACYTYYVWRRIPFAAANLNTGMTAVKANGCIFIMAYGFVALTWVYTSVWFIAVIGVNDQTNIVDENGEVTEDPGRSKFCRIPCTQSLLVSSQRGGLFPMKHQAVAPKPSWGALHLLNSARNDNDMDGCAAFLLCLVDCCLQCFQEILEYFNKYGYGYFEAGKNVITLFKQKGWTVIVNDDLIANTLSLFNLVVGLLVGGFGVLLKNSNPDWFEIFPDDVSATAVAFFFPFVVGIVISAVMFSVIDSSVNTVIVCFAEGPAEFEQNHPDLSLEMHEGWRKVYPEECGF
eukprot:scaffold95438_cov78-Cyclotella_meneghiniana.AAC.3